MLSYLTLKVDNFNDLDKILIYLKRKRKTFIIFRSDAAAHVLHIYEFLFIYFILPFLPKRLNSRWLADQNRGANCMTKDIL